MGDFIVLLGILGDLIVGDLIVLLGRTSLVLIDLGDGNAAAMLLMPRHVTATEVFSEKKLSQDGLVLAFA